MAQGLFEDGCYSCRPGIDLIAKVLAGKCKMNYTKATVGKGKIQDGQDPKTMEQVAEYVMDAQISAVTTPVNGECQVTVQINSSNVEEGFFATGIMLYANDPDSGDVPYTYLVLEKEPEWIRPSSSAIGKLATFNLIVAVGEVDQVSATIDPDSIMTHEAAEQMIEEKTDPQFKAVKDDIQIIFKKQDRLKTGRDLTVVFADEIKKRTDPWDWIEDRITKGNFDGLHVEDYIPFDVGGEHHEAQIAGINSYFNTGYNEKHGNYDTTDLTPIPNHIDFISRDCMAQTIQWNTTDTNCGTGDGNTDDGTDAPWLTSNIKSKLDEIFETLPEELKKVITEKTMILERRAKKEPALTASTSWHWYPMGKLWLPTEYEVFGSVIWGTPGFSSGQALQYPIFANNWLNRIKGAGPGGGRCDWWLAVVSGLSATGACGVHDGGYAGGWTATNQYRAPLCFRICAKRNP